MHPTCLQYSLDPKLTLKQLKKWDLPKPQKTPEQTQLKTFITQHNIQGSCIKDTNFHYKFSHIKSAPYLMYRIWDITLLNKPILAIVGPRLMTTYAKQILNQLFLKLKNYNLVTISGLAEGVDQRTHALSIKHNIPTIAVLGSGLGQYLKSRNRQFAKIIVKNNGLILSEYKIFQKATNYTFPQRNRIIAGLSDTIFIPEAGIKSWSLITANFAIEMKKEIYGTPNSIFSQQSQWIHDYIAKQKIQLCTSEFSFISKHFQPQKNSHFNHNGEILHIKTTSQSSHLPSDPNHEPKWNEVKRPSYTFQNTQTELINLTKNQKIIIKTIQKHSKLSLSELQHHTKLETSQILITLSQLELKDLINQPNPGIYMLKN